MAIYNSILKYRIGIHVMKDAVVTRNRQEQDLNIAISSNAWKGGAACAWRVLKFRTDRWVLLQDTVESTQRKQSFSVTRKPKNVDNKVDK